MAAVTIRLDMDGVALGGSLDALTGALANLAPAMERAGPALLDSVLTNFVEQGRPVKWQPLAPSTVRRKGHSVILFESGRLMSSIGFEAGRDYIRLSATTPYAAYQQRGVYGLMPARPFLLVQDADLPGILSAITAQITQTVSSRL